LESIYEIKPDEYSYLKKGDKLPDFHWQDETGTSFSSEKLSGKDTLIILFATNCRHCRDNFAYLEKELFSGNPEHINIMAIGRGCDFGQLELYNKRYTLSIKLTADPRGEIYTKFAEKAVPRVYHFSRNGTLIRSVRGFRPFELEVMIKELAV
jgi:peroxiredoxin